MSAESSSQLFHAATILSTLHGRLLDAENGIGGMGDLLSYMAGDQILQPQIGRVQSECVGSLALQHPDLAALELPGSAEVPTYTDFQVWLGVTMLETGGDLMRPVSPLDPADHTSMDLATELQLRGMGDKMPGFIDLGQTEE